jgi:ankyrin repeat protein
MKSVKCNLVLANDVVTRNNMVITAEESIYGETKDRKEALDTLAEMTQMRADLTYTRSNWIDDADASLYDAPKNFIEVVRFLQKNGGFIENNSNGFTPGHFCYRTGPNTFVSSQRKNNHNTVGSGGMSKVSVGADGVFTVIGRKKASVGARSQWLMLDKYEGYDCIVHTHNPLVALTEVKVIPQKPYQCGSLECGMNTLGGLEQYGDLKAVYLEKHGINILFKSTTEAYKIIDFIKTNIKLGEKVK